MKENMSNRIYIILALVWFCISACNMPNKNLAGIQSANTSAKSGIDLEISKIMSKMTLEDKVGEMTQLSIDVLSVGQPYNLKEPHELDPKKLQEILVDYKVGSILNCGGHAYTKEHWYDIISTIQDYAMNKKESGIPVLYGIDAIHGANYTQEATLFPQQIGQAATWNPELSKEAGRITAYETRASSIPWTFSPVLDMGRDARWPRFWETFGEDVHLASEMGEALVKGYEGEGNELLDKEHISSCMKHFLGYSVTLSGKDRTPAWVPERQLREYFLPTFQKAIDNGAHTIMICSGEMNGIPVHADKKILTDLLKEELGFKGIVLTDWEDIKYLYSRHRVAEGDRDAVKMAINAGIDMSMVPMDLSFTKTLKSLVEDGEVPMSRIDDAVERILRVKLELDLFKNPTTHYKDYPDFASDKHARASLKTAEESITLLKNEKGILPLSKDGNYLVTGPTAHSLNYLNGGWTHTWQGDKTEWNTKGKLTILDALKSEIGNKNITYLEGSTIDEPKDLAAAADAAKGKTAAIVCIGEQTYTEVIGNIGDLVLPKAQIDLVNAIAETGTPIVLVVVEGRPRIITECDEKSQATVLAYLPGNEGGIAISNILFGNVNPSGKLPFTYPREPHSLVTYDHKGTDKVHVDFSMNAFTPLYEFGHGLSYTNFRYSELILSSASVNENDKLEVSVNVQNTGTLEGKEVVQLYVTDKVASITPSVKRLKAFEKISLGAGEAKTVSFEISPEDLAFVGQDNKWITEPGAFNLQIEKLNQDFTYDGEVKVFE